MYKKYMNDALKDYVESGGSVYNMALATKEYIFKYPEGITEDKRKQLDDKAVKAIDKDKELPQGMELIKIILHEVK